MNELFAAVSKMQGELRGAIKDSKNPFYKSNYADLGSCWDACREPLVKNGLCVIQTTHIEAGGGIALKTMLGHSSGQFIESFYPINPVKNDPQGIGSAITYARRYALAAILGLHQTDDDGESATRPKKDYGIRPVQPEPGEAGELDMLGYKIPFGKFANRTLEEVGVDALRSYVVYLEGKAKKDGQEIDSNGVVGVFIKHVEDYVGAFENQP